MSSILLLGRTGQLGWELRRTLMPLGSVTAFDAPEIDIRDRDQMQRLVREIRPSIVINATAYTAVDRAEAESEAAYAINGEAPGFLAEIAREAGAAFLHYSTDYVFDGEAGRPYVENDAPNPLSVYAHSKLAGETAVQQAGGAYLILRTSWVYSLRRDSFVTKVLEWARRQSVVRAVSDQISNPTWARSLAEATAQVILLGSRRPELTSGWFQERAGVYHLAGDGFASRFEWAQAILRFDPRPEERCIQDLQPALTSEFPTPARRPLFTALDCSLFTDVFGLRLPPWEYALQLAMEA